MLDNTLEILFINDNLITAVCEKTGQYFEFDSGKLKNIDSVALVERFRLQSQSRKILKNYRVSNCLQFPFSKSDFPSIHTNKSLNSVFFSGLQTCGSVWHCPVCAAKISQRRALEIQIAIDYFKNSGGYISFVTRTVPHQYGDDLKHILDKYRKSDAYLYSDSMTKKIIKSFSVVGRIKVFEITHGENGWHLHTHEIYFHDSNFIKCGVDYLSCLENLRKNLFFVWKKSTLRSGFSEISERYGVHVTNGDFAQDYVTKFGRESNSDWSVDRELVSQHIKKSKKGHSPFDLLRNSFTCEYFSDLFKNYADVMHGQRQLIWSRGLKKLCTVTEKTDSELANEIREDSVLFAVLPFETWDFILKNKLQTTVLLIAKYFSFSHLVQFLLDRGCKTLPMDYKNG